MLKRFEVKGFKNFRNKMVVDFTDVKDYQFNRQCIKNRLINKMIIYGKNSVGKSNLGLAIFDITTHLADKNVSPGLYRYYLNADINAAIAEFVYIFQFGENEVKYEYAKTDINELIYERLFIDEKELFYYDYIGNDTKLDGLFEYAPSLNLDFRDVNLSILRYVVGNSRSKDVEVLAKLMRFVSNMLWVRSLNENRFIGYKADSSDFHSFIFEGDNLNEFQNMLKRAGMDTELIVLKDISGDKVLYLNKTKRIPFLHVASNGTMALYTVFYWLKTCPDLSFLFIDEFDAYYHVELAETIVDMIEQMGQFQTIFTSHNTKLLSNRIMRPDCYLILSDKKIVSFANATTRELREGHNLEKLYISGEFDG